MSTLEENINDYEGETKKRNTTIALLMTLFCPGLGYMYTGQLYKGISVNFAFLIMVETFVISFSVLKFFPLLPLLVLGLAWFVFTLFVMFSVRQSTQNSENFLLKGYNHWVLYTLVFLFTFALPLYLTKHFVSEFAVGIQAVEDDGMLPTLHSGDMVLVDRSSFLKKDPLQGDLVWVKLKNGKKTILRVVGVGKDTVEIEGELVFLNDKNLKTKGFPTKSKMKKGLLAMVEQNRDSAYLISTSPRALNEVTIAPVKISENHLFLMTDNRSQIGRKIRDSRNFGTISKDQILGRPIYITWAKDQSVSWKRIGLALR